eukprot:5526035-Amphidinium_carterae.1
MQSGDSAAFSLGEAQTDTETSVQEETENLISLVSTRATMVDGAFRGATKVYTTNDKKFQKGEIVIFTDLEGNIEAHRVKGHGYDYGRQWIARVVLPEVGQSSTGTAQVGRSASPPQASVPVFGAQHPEWKAESSDTLGPPDNSRPPGFAAPLQCQAMLTKEILVDPYLDHQEPILEVEVLDSVHPKVRFQVKKDESKLDQPHQSL